MELEEIRELAGRLGLNPKHLLFKEPYFDSHLNGKRYRFKYSVNGGNYEYNFIVSRLDIEAGVEPEVVRLYVNLGLQELKGQCADRRVA